MTDPCNLVHHAIELEQQHFPEDKMEDCQKKCITSGVINNQKLCMNEMNESSFEDAPTISVKKEDYEFLLDCFENFNKDKKKKAEIQKRYFENHKKEYYERQKKWRDNNRVRINLNRRKKYNEKKHAGEWHSVQGDEIEPYDAPIIDCAGNDVSHLVHPDKIAISPETSNDDLEISYLTATPPSSPK